MGKQQHDQGHRKRKQASARHKRDTTTISPETLARQLVDRGLCNERILDLPYRTPKENHYKQD